MFVRPLAPVKPEYAELIETKFDTWSLHKVLLGYLILGSCRPLQQLLQSKMHCNFTDPKSIVVMLIVCTACWNVKNLFIAHTVYFVSFVWFWHNGMEQIPFW
jgi:hypothetical protein